MTTTLVKPAESVNPQPQPKPDAKPAQKPKEKRRPNGTGSIEPKGNSWQGRWHVDGKPVKRSLGLRKECHPDGLTKTQAEVVLREKMAEYEPVRTLVTTVLTYKEVGDTYLAHLKVMGRKKSTIEGYESLHRNHLCPAFGDKPANDVDDKDLERLQAKLMKTHAPRTVNGCVSLANGTLKFAKKRGWRLDPIDPIEQVKMDKDEEIHFLNPVELEDLLAAVPDDPWGAFERVLYVFAAMTGLRMGECLGIRWRDIDWAAMRVRVRKNYVRGEDSSTKGRRGRSVPMAERVANVLEGHHRRSRFNRAGDRVFGHPDSGNPLDRSKILKRFKKAIIRAGIGEIEMRVYKTRKGAKDKVRPYTPITFHDLRHTFGTTMAAAGVPIRSIQEWMGHRDIQTTMIYTHFAPSEKEAELIEHAFATLKVPDDPGGIAELAEAA